MSNMQTLWVTKYALSDGIKSGDWDGVVRYGRYVSVHGYCNLMVIGRDAHKTEADARAASEMMRLKKIKSLEKQIQKLQALKFRGDHEKA